MLAENQIGAGESHVLGTHDFVGGTILQHAMLVDARFVRERVLPDDRLVPLHLHAGDLGNQLAGREQLGRVDLGIAVVVVGTGLEGHDDFFEGCIAGSFAETIDRAFDLSRAGFDRRQAVGDGEAQVIMTVRADDGLVDVRHILLERVDDLEVMSRCGIADGVGDVDRGRAGGDGFLDDFAEKIELRACSVFGGELDVIAEGLGSLHGLDGFGDDFGLLHLQLELPMDRAGGEEHVDPFLGSILQGGPGAVDVFFAAASQSANDGSVAELASNRLDRFKIARGSDGEARFDDVDPQFDERLGDLQLFSRVHTAARRLFAVT